MNYIKKSIIIWTVAVGIHLFVWLFLRDTPTWADGDMGKYLATGTSVFMIAPVFNEARGRATARQDQAFISWRPVLKEYLRYVIVLAAAFCLSSILRTMWKHQVSPLIACQDDDIYLSAIFLSVIFVAMCAMSDYRAVRAMRKHLTA